MDRCIAVLLALGLLAGCGGPGLGSCAAAEVRAQASTFLRQGGDLEETSTLGLIAEGIETLNRNLQSSVTTLSDQQTAFATQQEATNHQLLSLQAEQLRNQIDEDQFQINDLQRQIDGLQVSIEAADLGCEANADCRSCAQGSSCVWCVATQSCMTGGPDGPDNGECANYEYQMCQSEICESIETCRECLERSDCGWCLSGADCVPAAQADSLCDAAYYFQASLGSGFNTCPAGTDGDNQDTSEGDYRVREVQIYQDRIVDLQGEIDRLNEELDSVNELLGGESVPGATIDLTSLEGLGERVDQLAEEQQGTTTFLAPEPAYTMETDELTGELYEEEPNETSGEQEVSSNPAEVTTEEQPSEEQPSEEQAPVETTEEATEPEEVTEPEEITEAAESEEVTEATEPEEAGELEEVTEAAEPEETTEATEPEEAAEPEEATESEEASQPEESPSPPAGVSPAIAEALESIRAEAEVASAASDVAERAADNAEAWGVLTQNYTDDLEFTLDAVNDSRMARALSFLEMRDSDDDFDETRRNSHDDTDEIPLNSTANTLPSSDLAPVNLVTDTSTSFLQTVFSWFLQVP